MNRDSLVIGTPVTVELLELIEPAGPSGEPEQWGFMFGERLCLIAQVLDGWSSDDSKYLEVVVQDGRRFMLRHDGEADEWTASAFVRPVDRA